MCAAQPSSRSSRTTYRLSASWQIKMTACTPRRASSRPRSWCEFIRPALRSGRGNFVAIDFFSCLVGSCWGSLGGMRCLPPRSTSASATLVSVCTASATPWMMVSQSARATRLSFISTWRALPPLYVFKVVCLGSSADFPLSFFFLFKFA